MFFSSQIAFNVDYGNFALIFGFNSFIALAMQSLLTFIVVDGNGPLELDVKTQVCFLLGIYQYITVRIFLFLVCVQTT